MELNEYIEHTLLKPEATEKELETLFEEAKTCKFKGVCVNPINVKSAKKALDGTDVKVVTVVGFPLGATFSEIKAREAELAIKDGADEVDMVINVGKLKDGKLDFVTDDIATVKKACGQKVLKVIIETDLLTEEEIVKACKCAVSAKADFVKTSTGFVKNGVGAKVEDVKLMYETVKDAGLGVKASGGIRDREKAVALVEAGATRLGTSSGLKIVNS